MDAVPSPGSIAVPSSGLIHPWVRGHGGVVQRHPARKQQQHYRRSPAPEGSYRPAGRPTPNDLFLMYKQRLMKESTVRTQPLALLLAASTRQIHMLNVNGHEERPLRCKRTASSQPPRPHASWGARQPLSSQSPSTPMRSQCGLRATWSPGSRSERASHNSPLRCEKWTAPSQQPRPHLPKTQLTAIACWEARQPLPSQSPTTSMRIQCGLLAIWEPRLQKRHSKARSVYE